MMTYTLNNEKKAIEKHRGKNNEKRHNKKDATRIDVTTEFDFDDLEMVSGGGIVSILKKGVDIIKHLFD